MWVGGEPARSPVANNTAAEGGVREVPQDAYPTSLMMKALTRPTLKIFGVMYKTLLR